MATCCRGQQRKAGAPRLDARGTRGVALGGVDELGDRGRLGTNDVAAQQPDAGRGDEHEPEEEPAEAEQADGLPSRDEGVSTASAAIIAAATSPTFFCQLRMSPAREPPIEKQRSTIASDIVLRVNRPLCTCHRAQAESADRVPELSAA